MGRVIGLDALVAYARREVDAVTAATRVCDAVVAEGGRSARCALVAAERSTAAVLAGTVDEEAAILMSAVGVASSRRLTLDRKADDIGLFSKVKEEIDWIAVEPITARNGTWIGALVAMGPRTARSDVLGALPGAALICGTVAVELFCQAIFGRRLHRFNNLLAKLSANVEQLATAIASPTVDLTDESGPGTARDELVACAEFAAEGVSALLDAGADLRDALPIRAHWAR